MNVSVISDASSEYAKRLKEHNIEVLDAKPNRKINLNTIALIRKTIKNNNIDIVYAANSRTIPNAAFACIGLKVKLIVYRGTTGGIHRHDPSAYLSILHPRIDGIICVSKAVEKHVRQRVSSRVKRHITTIYKGHNINWYNKPKADLSEFSHHKKDFFVACVANARPHKGLIYILKAARQLSDLKNLHIMLVGEKISQEPYVSLIKDSGMQERIHLTGYRNDAPEVIAACNVLVLPSLREGLPRVILESLAYGTRVITSANQGSMEIIDDGVNGYVVPLKGDSAIAERIRELYLDPEKLKNLKT